MAEEIPLIKIDNKDFICQTTSSHSNYEESYLDKLFVDKWKDAENRQVLNYEVQHIYTKILNGDYSIICQLNPMRKAKRRAPQLVSGIKQPFDPHKFNFSQIRKEEILFKLVIDKSLMKSSKLNGEEEEETSEVDDLTTTIIVNCAPITSLHCLVVPSLHKLKPQVLDYDGLFVAISLILASNTPALKVAFNSLGAFASVNHYHLHAYYLPHPLLIETTLCQKLVGPVYTFKDHYAPGFVFQLEDQDVESLVKNSVTLINLLLDEEVCHNVMITRGIRNHVVGNDSRNYDTVRVCIWARRAIYGVKDIGSFVPAVCELSGHLPVYDEDAWESVTEQAVKEMSEEVCLQQYTRVLPKIQQLFS